MRRGSALALLVAAVTAIAAAPALIADGRESRPSPQPAVPSPAASADPAAPVGATATPTAAPVPRDRRRRPPRPHFHRPPGGYAVTAPGAGRPRGGALVDVRSGRVLWARGWRTPRSIASLTKVMTALLAVEALRPRERVTVPAHAVAIRGSKAGLTAGARLAADDLLQALLLPSGNDAAIALAEAAAGSQRAFVRRMNRRARAWGLRCTRFVNVHGLGLVRGNTSCPADLAELTRRALREPRVARVAARPAAQVRSGAATLHLRTTNPLLSAGTAGVIGLKTGWSPPAGHCLIAVQRTTGGRRLAVILLDAADTAGAARALLSAV